MNPKSSESLELRIQNCILSSSKKRIEILGYFCPLLKIHLVILVRGQVRTINIIMVAINHRFLATTEYRLVLKELMGPLKTLSILYSSTSSFYISPY